MSYTDEQENTDALSNPSVITAVMLAIAGLVLIIGCGGIYFFVSQNSSRNVQGTTVIQISSAPSLTPSLTAIPTETLAPTLEEGSGGGGVGDTPTPDLTATVASIPAIRYATISEIKGTVQIKTLVNPNFTIVTSDLSIPAGTTILTGDNSTAKISMTEGSVVRISSQTQVTLTTLGGTTVDPVTELTLDFGKVWTIVSSSLGTGKFEVDTPLGTASVIGSYMSTEHNTTAVLDVVTCLEGHCRYSNNQGVQNMTDLQQITIGSGSAPGSPSDIDINQLAGWNVTNVPEVIDLTPTATPTATATASRTPTNTRTPSNTPGPSNTPDVAGTNAQATANQQAANNAATSTQQAFVSNLTSTVFFFNSTATALAGSTQNSFTATAFSFTATAFNSTANANATNSVFTATAAQNATNIAAANGTNTQVAANLTGTVAATQTQIASTNTAATATQAAAATATAAIPVIQFNPLSYSVNEGAGTVSLTVTMSQPVNSSNVTVNYSFSNVSAQNADYSDAGSGSIQFNPGDTSKTITINITDDGANESNEQFQVTLALPGSPCSPACSPTPILGSNKIATVTIVNQTQPTVGFSSASYGATETDSNTTATITVSLSRAYANTTTVMVNYSTTAGGTATGGGACGGSVDFVSIASTGLTFSPGETSKTFDVTICGDTLNEPSETIFLSLASPTNATLGVASATLTITDNDPQPTVSMSVVSNTVAEPANPPTVQSVTFTVSISAASGQTVTVAYATGGGTATAGSDYTSASGTLTWTVGDSANKSVTVNVNADFVYEPTETFNFTLSSPTNATITGTNPQTISITNDAGDTAPSVSFSAQPYTVNEPSSGTVNKTITVNLNKASGESITLSFLTSDGNASSCPSNGATAGSDYVSTSGSLVFSPGDISKSFDVTVNSDGVTESGGECLTLTLNLQSGTTSGTVFPVTSVLWIYDP